MRCVVSAFVVVIGHGPDLEAEEGAATLLRTLGAEVRTLDLWEDGAALFTATSEVLAYAVAHTDPAAARQIGLVIGWRQLLDEDGRGAGLNLRARTRGPDPAPLSIPQTRLASVRSR